jgi:hypothetical protein
MKANDIFYVKIVRAVWGVFAVVLMATVLLFPVPATASSPTRHQSETKIGDMIYFTPASIATKWQIQLYKLNGGTWSPVSTFGTRTQNSTYFDRFDFYNVTANPPSGAGLGYFTVRASYDNGNTWRVCSNQLIDFHLYTFGRPRSVKVQC